ncbi:MAG TPA: DNA-binding domain-containing protein [Opitutaceae bacterium]|jgi:hypothetical protein
MKKPPRHAPSRVASTSDLRLLQRLMAAAIVRPLDVDDRLQAVWIDGRTTQSVAEEFIKPNDRLSSMERLQLYSQMYWFRLFDAIRDDCPGLLAVLGEGAFSRLAQAYLAERPSRSFTLRNLCSRLEDFMRAHPRLTAPKTRLALDMARFEWAQTVAFDGVALPVVDPARLAKTPPSRLRLGLQPYVTLLDLSYPIDRYMLAIKKRDALRSEASNAPDSKVSRRRVRQARLPRPGRTLVAVHRLDNQLYYKRLERPAFLILSALAAGSPLSRAVSASGKGAGPAEVQDWFRAWMALGWFCAPGNKRRAKAS